MTTDIILVFLFPAMLIVASTILLAHIPKKNDLYGYKTVRSSKSEGAWRYANKVASLLMIFISLISLIIGSLLLGLKYLNDFSNINIIIHFGVSFAVLIILPISITEILLHKREQRILRTSDKNDN